MKLAIITQAIVLLLVSSFCLSDEDGSRGFAVFKTLNSETPPANIGVSKDGRIFMSTHQAYGSPHKMVEFKKDGSYQPYPKYDFFPALNGILGTVVDQQGILWFLDTIWGRDTLGRVIGWDIEKNTLYKIFYIARPVVNDAYILNDLAVDRVNEAIYITETGSATTSALLVLDLKTGLVRRVLSGSQATVPEDKTLKINGETVFMQGEEARVGVNPITIDVQNKWVYFAPMSSHSLYRVKTSDLNNEHLSQGDLAGRVERYASKPMGDGITIDSAGNLYVSDLEANAIGVITQDREYEILFQDDDILSWVEGFSNAGPMGIYATANKLHQSPAFNNKKPVVDEFYIVNFQPQAFAELGR